jgi:hypothetical protein
VRLSATSTRFATVDVTSGKQAQVAITAVAHRERVVREFWQIVGVNSIYWQFRLRRTLRDGECC